VGTFAAPLMDASNNFQLKAHGEMVTPSSSNAAMQQRLPAAALSCVPHHGRWHCAKAPSRNAAPNHRAEQLVPPPPSFPQVTCLDCVDTLLLSAAADTSLHFWDMRNLSVSPAQGCAPVAAMSVGPTPAVKVRAGGSPVPSRAAISTFNSVALVDYSNLAAPIVAPPAVQYQHTSGWIEIRWAGGKLYSAGSENVDVFELV
jgi:hypothetical protein